MKNYCYLFLIIFDILLYIRYLLSLFFPIFFSFFFIKDIEKNNGNDSCYLVVTIGGNNVNGSSTFMLKFSVEVPKNNGRSYRNSTL